MADAHKLLKLILGLSFFARLPASRFIVFRSFLVKFPTEIESLYFEGFHCC